MLVHITLNGSTLSTGSNLTDALEQLVHRIHPKTVKDLFLGKEPVTDADGTWNVERENAFDAGMIRAACESSEGFVTVQARMRGGC